VLIFFVAITAGMFILWVSIIHMMGKRARLFLARHQWILLLFHIPVMIFFASIGGEGMIFASASFIGGILGQLYLSVWGMNRGLTFWGHKTGKYVEPVKIKKIRLRDRIDLAVTNKLLGQ
jgi:polyferredoxin